MSISAIVVDQRDFGQVAADSNTFQFETAVDRNGYRYVLNRTYEAKRDGVTKAYYRCQHRRSSLKRPMGCMASMEISRNSSGETSCTELKEIHTCTEKRLLSEAFSLEESELSARKSKASGGSDISKSSTTAATGGCLSTSGGGKFGLRFDMRTVMRRQMQRMMGWSHPSLIHLLRQPNVNLFVHLMTDCAPDGFNAVIAVLVYAAKHHRYVPVFHIAVQIPTAAATSAAAVAVAEEDVFQQALSQLIAQSEWTLDPATVVCDFRAPVLAAVETQFSNAKKIFCPFHWKQSLRQFFSVQQQQQLPVVPEELITALLGAGGAIELLAVAPAEDLCSKAVRYVRSKIAEEEYAAQFDEFWQFFCNDWLLNHPPQFWNLPLLKESETAEVTLINRTNNPLEQYCVELATALPLQGQPSLPQFVDFIRQQALKEVEQLRVSKNNNSIGNSSSGSSSSDSEPSPMSEDAAALTLPDDYAQFI